MSVFNRYAEWYDILYQDKDYRGEARFVAKILKKHGARGGSLLDFGCGTAAHAEQMASHYQEIVGVDLSEQMLTMAQARQRRMNPSIANRIKLRQGDIRKARLRRTFDSVTAMFHVLSYQTTNEDAHATLRTLATHVEKGGHVLFDFWYGPGVLTDRPTVRTKEITTSDWKLTRKATPTLSPNRNTVLVHYDLKATDRTKQTTYSIKEDHLMRYFFKPELDLLCAEAGIEIIEFGEWMTARTPSLETWAAYIVGRVR